MIRPEGRSSKRLSKDQIYKIVLFCSVLTIVTMLFLIFHRPAPMTDYSKGRYSRTFETGYKPLSQELEFLKKEGFFTESEEIFTPVPVIFTAWYNAPLTRAVIQERYSALSDFEQLVKDGLESAVKQKPLYFSDPLENPVPADLFLSLEKSFEYYLSRQNYRKSVAFLKYMFCYSSLLMCSNAPDVYFLEKSVVCARRYELVFRRNRQAISAWERIREKITEEYVFPYQNLYRFDRLRSMRDFEKIRRHGIGLFYGTPSFSVQLKEGIETCSFSRIGSAFQVLFRDWFYEPDRDQKLNLAIYRALLYQGASPKTVARPDRRMALLSLQRMSRDAEILSSSLEYLEKRGE